MLKQLTKRRFSNLSAKTQRYLDLEKKYISQSNYVVAPLVIERGQGIYLYDVDGNRYMDMLAGFGSVSQGHCHPRIAETIAKQTF